MKNLPFALLLLGLLFVFYYQESPKTLQAEVIQVYDGDTLTAMHNKETIKVRLFGIDAPELKQEFGKEAREYLKNLCLHKTAKIQIYATDKYKRHVAKVYCDEIEANKELVVNGFAWAYTDYSFAYKGKEFQAREAKAGLWHNNNPIEPKKFRRQGKHE